MKYKIIKSIFNYTNCDKCNNKVDDFIVNHDEMERINYQNYIVCPKCQNHISLIHFDYKFIYEKAEKTNHDLQMILKKNNLIDKKTNDKIIFEMLSSANIEYQQIIHEFLRSTKDFKGFSMSGKHGNVEGFFNSNDYLYIRKNDAKTLYHEIGHAIYYFRNDFFDVFNQVLKFEYKQQSIRENLKLYLDEHTKLNEIYNQKLLIQRKYEPYRKSIKNLNTEDKIIEMNLFKELSQIARIFNSAKHWSDIYSELIDIYGSITDSSSACYRGHGKKYWELDNKIKENEFFAELFSLNAVNDNLQLNLINKLFPKTIREYNNIIKVLKGNKINERY